MRSILLPLLVLFSLQLGCQNACPKNEYSTLFGQAKQFASPIPNNTYRIYLDQEGHYYPDYPISDESLRASCSRLHQWYNEHPEAFLAICKIYQVAAQSATSKNIELLEQAIINQHQHAIEKALKHRHLATVYIHGFRKKLYGKQDAYATYSSVDNQILAHAFGRKEGLQIEIYWDSKFITPLQSWRFKGLELFEQGAIPAAQQCGWALRSVISNIPCTRLQIITHSLGAKVACHLLFSKDPKQRKTPSQKRVEIALIAPAIGHTLFENYYDRNTSIPFQTSDNYHWFILINRNDFALQKQYGFGVKSTPLHYGNTSLGCDYHNDTDHLKQLFKTRYTSSEVPIIFDCSLNKHGHPVRCHLVRCYCEHSEIKKVVAILR